MLPFDTFWSSAHGMHRVPVRPISSSAMRNRSGVGMA